MVLKPTYRIVGLSSLRASKMIETLGGITHDTLELLYVAARTFDTSRVLDSHSRIALMSRERIHVLFLHGLGKPNSQEILLTTITFDSISGQYTYSGVVVLNLYFSMFLDAIDRLAQMYRETNWVKRSQFIEIYTITASGLII